MAKEVLEMEVKSNTGEVTKDVEKLDKATNKAAGGFGGIGRAIKGVGTAIKAAGIGLLVGLIAKLMEVLSKNQNVLDFFNSGMTALSIAFNDLFGYIEDNVGAITGFFNDLFTNPAEKIKEMGTAVKEGLIDRFNEFVEVLGLAGKALGQLVTGEFSAAFDTIKEAGKQTIDVVTGIDNSFEQVAETITNYTKKVVEQAVAITETSKAAERAAVEFARLNAQYLKDAEVQRQIRDDETKTFVERIAANEELNKILEKQQAAQKEQIQIQIAAAQAQFDINGSNENFILLEEQKVALLELEETITGQLSEQKTNQVALEKELLESQNELRAEGLSGIDRELAELESAYKLKLDMARKSGVETTAIDAQYAKQRADIVREGVTTQLEAYSGLAGALGALAGESKELAFAQAIIDTYAGANKAFAQGGTLGFVTGAAIIAQGLANVRTIMQTEVPSSGGGGGGAAPAAPAPQMMSGSFDLSSGVAPEATRAYVVTDEMTNSQNQLANIRRRATI
tara:strand:- start:114 stop:1646 length:1533 start_codon:yes stop_codon:yes gene_type:complete